MPPARGHEMRTLWAAAVASLVALVALAGTAGAAVPVVKMTLPHSIPPKPVFLKAGVCGATGASDTAVCNATILKAIDNARHTEPLASITKSFRLAAFDKLSPAGQLLAIADIERMTRGVQVVYGITAQLDAIALAGASKKTDPTIKKSDLPLVLKPGGGSANAWGANLARGTANALGADYYWMYDDGLSSPNKSCTKANESSCWAHRKNILENWGNPAFCPGSPTNVLMGAAEVTNVSSPPSIAEIFVNDCGALPTRFVATWSQVEKRIFAS